jgi:hypothetical protein
MKEIFKVEDKVFDFKYGWGFVYDASCPIIVRFSEYTASYAKKDLKTLSFTEYTLQGFSQERPIELPEVGDRCLVRNEDYEPWYLAVFYGVQDNIYIARHKNLFFGSWKQLRRIKILD